MEIDSMGPMATGSSSATGSSRGRRRGGRGSGGGSGRGRRRGGGIRGGRNAGTKGSIKQPNKDALDTELDNYMMRDPTVAKSRLDQEIEAYQQARPH